MGVRNAYRWEQTKLYTIREQNEPQPGEMLMRTETHSVTLQSKYAVVSQGIFADGILVRCSGCLGSCLCIVGD